MDSLLSQLTSLATIAMAIGLAYVRLDRFHYRDRIRDRARTNLDRFNDDPKIIEKFQGLHTIAVLQYLADDPIPSVNRDLNPATSLPWLYRNLVAPSIDRLFCWTGVCLSLSVVLIGRFQGLDVEFVLTEFESRTIAVLVGFVLSILLAFEVILVRIGDWIQARMYDVIALKYSEFEKEISNLIDSLEFSNFRNNNHSNGDEESLSHL